jgi:hypothetical protein
MKVKKYEQVVEVEISVATLNKLVRNYLNEKGIDAKKMYFDYVIKNEYEPHDMGGEYPMARLQNLMVKFRQ